MTQQAELMLFMILGACFFSVAVVAVGLFAQARLDKAETDSELQGQS